MTDYTDHLATGCTTLARCYILTRRDGVVMGFTDHDRDIDLDGTRCAAGAALDASTAARSLGITPDDMDAGGALSADAITEADLRAGRYDGAQVEVWEVNWTDPAVRGRLGVYTIGQVERGPLAFRAELRTRPALWNRPEGRIHTALCDVDRLGDHRCKLALGPWQSAATVIEADGADLIVSGLDETASNIFDRGVLDWTGGANAGTGSDIRVARPVAGGVRVSLWSAPPFPITAGDTANATVGCDRTADTCRNRFDNLANFRGFPLMPGESFISEYARPGDPDQSGGSRYD
ncbi:gene transfer agent [Dinoroseobacter phage vB_DshS-R4C]|uniref:Gene transfer agent n=1 Tax=Dinoroseobacter phage vB_DshS-R4C TaxID=2590919 RepID=A0ACD6BAB6_9CAUD|nr:gene transfer agent [Dinoroseobacter phage vB_DshS-R4C]8GTC_P Chain P, Hub protein [Dinoroseobacter phage vB_DshS-R4C]8GTC_Q Chain Q, Hub protein [Dinoroseobacter phage vB_DshS-R4C]8GTC_R Chain R, Hub protein [Dinoroseobacter phage vB_DshS-R4C]